MYVKDALRFRDLFRILHRIPMDSRHFLRNLSHLTYWCREDNRALHPRLALLLFVVLANGHLGWVPLQ